MRTFIRKIREFLQFLFTFKRAPILAVILWAAVVIAPWVIIAHLTLIRKGLSMEDIEGLADWQNPVVWAGIAGVILFWIFVVWVSDPVKKKSSGIN